MKKILTLLTIYFLSFELHANQLEDFIKYAEYETVKISPDGKHLAVKTTYEGYKVLAFLDYKTKKLHYLLRLAKKRNVGSFYWMNNERVVLDVTYSYGPLDEPQRDGSLYAVNYDGAKGRYIFGSLTPKSKISSNSTALLSGTPQIISTLKNDDRYIYVSVYPYRRHTGQLLRPTELIRIDAYNGKQKNLMRSPGRGGGFFLDHNDEVRFANGIKGYENTELFYREPEGEWQLLEDIVENDSIEIHGFNESNEKFYFSAFKDGDTGTLYSYRLRDKKINKIYHNKSVRLTRILTNFQDIPYGVEINEDYSNFLFFTKKVKHAALHEQLYQSFNGDSVYITSSTDDGKNIIVFTMGDKNPGTYYSFDTETNKAKYLLERNDWLAKKELATVLPYKFNARDGLELHGYLTLPHGKEAKNLPLVVNPHGGPHGPRDSWQFDWRVQALASQGYAVLQVNFRGSGGYGKKFEKAGHLQWGGKIQQDIIDATHWAVKSGYADKERICIYGGSFGGYSALMSAIIEPDLYKCTIGAYGVYDLPLLYADGDIPTSLYGKKFLDTVLGGNNDNLLKYSPVHQINNLKAPVLVIHGTADLRTPISQAEALLAALENKKHKVSKLIVDGEFHGFIKEQNRLDAMNKMVDFLNEHIGK
jgi:dipeptidyl aminopeptidase/acylaminoacyl peptidase